jgi:ParB-like chromosome segregation protein Spo0J
LEIERSIPLTCWLRLEPERCSPTPKLARLASFDFARLVDRMSMIAIKDIIIGERHRHDMGDIAGLAASIEAVGLLHPPVVDKNNVLVAGERRIRAALLLGWTDIQVTVVDIAEIVLGEYAENEVRKDFTLSEAVAIKRLVEPAIVAEAAARRALGENQYTETGEKLAQGSKGKARDKVAKRTGKSHTTLAKAEKVVEAAEAEPEKFGHLAEEMDRTGKADGPYKQLAASKVSPADAVKLAADRAATKTPKPVPDVAPAADRAEATGATAKPEEIRNEQMVESVARTPAKFREAMNQIAMAETSPEAFWAEAAREREFWDHAYEAAVTLLDSVILKVAAIKAKQPEAAAPAPAVASGD